MDAQRRGLDALAGLCNGNRRTLRSFCADVHDQIAVQRNVCGSEIQRAAFDGEILLGIDCVIDGGIDAQRQLTDGEGGFAFLCGGRAGLDAVFCRRR